VQGGRGGLRVLVQLSLDLMCLFRFRYHMYLKLDFFHFQIYTEEIPFQFNVGILYYFSFRGKTANKQQFFKKKSLLGARQVGITLAGAWAG
jgi:hypothetical protein